MLMPFGKYKGRELTEIPADYLYWLASLPDLRAPLKLALAAELRRREPSSSLLGSTPEDIVCVAKQIVSAGYRAMALRCHPDTGGTHEQMLAVNGALTMLQGLLR